VKESDILKTPKVVGGCSTSPPIKGEESGTYPIARWEDGDADDDVIEPKQVEKGSV